MHKSWITLYIENEIEKKEVDEKENEEDIDQRGKHWCLRGLDLKFEDELLRSPCHDKDHPSTGMTQDEGDAPTTRKRKREQTIAKVGESNQVTCQIYHCTIF